MITFNNLGKKGRIGNQLFQYAAIRNLSIKKNFEIGLPKQTNLVFHGQKNLLECFKIPKEFFGKTSILKKIIYSKYNEPDNKIDLNFFDIQDNTNIDGYFQSIYYFKDNSELIIKELTPKDQYIIEAKKKISQLKKANNVDNIVSLHIRRGDNIDPTIKGNNSDLLNSFGSSDDFKDNSFFGKYVAKAKSIFKNKKVKFLVFSGGSRGKNNKKDLDWCKKNFKGSEYIFNDDQDEISDFCLIYACDHNILSPGSSFGWWAAYLNRRKKIVVAPKHYNPSNPKETFKFMFYPDDWIIV